VILRQCIHQFSPTATPILALSEKLRTDAGGQVFPLNALRHHFLAKLINHTGLEFDVSLEESYHAIYSGKKI